MTTILEAENQTKYTITLKLNLDRYRLEHCKKIGDALGKVEGMKTLWYIYPQMTLGEAHYDYNQYCKGED